MPGSDMLKQTPNLLNPQNNPNRYFSKQPYTSRPAQIGLVTFSLWLGGISLLPDIAQAVKSAPIAIQNFLTMERNFETEFEDFFGENLAEVTQDPDDVAQTLLRISQKSNTQPAVLWVVPRADHLHLVLLLPGGQPIVRDLYDVPRSKLLKTVTTFREQMSEPGINWDLTTAQQLHQWLIAPFEQEHLKAADIDTLLFCMGNGLRGLPMAALHDGQSYLVERYSSTIIPAFNLIQTDYKQRQQGKILAGGASMFLQMTSLPAVPIEISSILSFLRTKQPGQFQWQGQSLLNRTFTLKNLKSQLQSQTFNIIHLATHAEFNPGKPYQSFIQFRDGRLRLDQMNDIAWSTPSLDLLVLSACKTALGDYTAELGFAGIALKAGVKTALGSLWYISDMGTLAVMSEFYQQLPHSPTKAEALRQAQLHMLRGQIRLQSGTLRLSNDSIPLPENIDLSAESDFSHPFYWSGFTMISSPW